MCCSRWGCEESDRTERLNHKPKAHTSAGRGGCAGEAKDNTRNVMNTAVC